MSLAHLEPPDNALRERQVEESLRVTSTELVDLVQSWSTYRGQRIGEERVRAWLEQFGGVREQRAMFGVLRHLRFYSNEFIRVKMREVDEIVRRGGEVVHRITTGKLKRSDLLVSYLDGPAKSGSHFARLYADEAKIYVDNIVEKSKLHEAIAERQEIQAIIFVDDFIGTGESACNNLEELDKQIGALVESRNLKVVFAAAVAYIDGWRQVEQKAEQLIMKVATHACEILDETAKCFNESVNYFRDQKERELAEHMSRSNGSKLEKRCPMGYGKLELAVVFERSCPNNSLPIFWSESTSPRWVPLFPRH